MTPPASRLDLPELPEQGLRLTARNRLAILGIWVALGLLESVKAWLSSPPGRGDWTAALVGNMPWWMMWAVLAPVVIALARRVRPDTGQPLRFCAAHLIAGTLLSLLHHAVVGTLYFYSITRGRMSSFGGELTPMTLPLQIRGFFAGYFMLNMLTYMAVVAAYYGHEYYLRHRHGELRRARLEASMHQARLTALRMELNPHFLFNTLNAIAGLVRTSDTSGAIRMLVRLSELLRATLERGNEQQVPLETELELLRLYLEIERVRFGDRLEVIVRADEVARHTLVPPLVLQPLVENAVKHGVARHSGNSRLEVRAEVAAGELVLTVTNTGQEFPQSRGESRPTLGIGLANTRQRLAEMYGAHSTLSLSVLVGGGARATIRIPCRAAAALDAVPASAVSLE
jgi:two-component system LytT family sensor kinase